MLSVGSSRRTWLTPSNSTTVSVGVVAAHLTSGCMDVTPRLAVGRPNRSTAPALPAGTRLGQHERVDVVGVDDGLRRCQGSRWIAGPPGSVGGNRSPRSGSRRRPPAMSATVSGDPSAFTRFGDDVEVSGRAAAGRRPSECTVGASGFLSGRPAPWRARCPHPTHRSTAGSAIAGGTDRRENETRTSAPAV